MDAGPFDIKHLVIGGIIILVTGIAMFMLKGLLSFGLVIPLWMIVIIIISTMVIVAILVMTITGYLRYGSEGFLFAKARKNGTGVYIDAELGSDVADFVLAEKASPKDVVLKDEESGIKVDPSLLSSNARPLRFKGGLDVYIYSYYNFMPQTIRNHAAFAAINRYFENECHELNFLSIKEFVELISDPEHFLERNATIKLNKYFKITEAKNPDDSTKIGDDGKTPLFTYARRYEDWIEEYTEADGTVIPRHRGLIEQDISLPNMIQLIAKARQDVSVMPIMGGLIAGTEAFKYNSVAYSSQHLGHVLMLYYTKMMEDLKGQIETWMYIIGLVAIIGAIGVSVYIASMAFKGGA
jgi:hypothetical protein